MVVIVPVDREVDEAQDVAEKHGQQRRECADLASVWRTHFEHHDRDDDGDDAVAECLEPGFSHGPELSAIRRIRSFPAHTLNGSNLLFATCDFTKRRAQATYQFS